MCRALHEVGRQACYAKQKINLACSNLDLLCICQSGDALFCENYAKLYFDAKHLEKGLNKGW